jgi:predicted metal-dependent peptidase
MPNTDPFARLEEAVRQQAQEEKAHKIIQTVLVRLFTGKDAKSPFFATLGLRLKAYPDWECETACTNGSELRYNPDFITQQDIPRAMGLMAHEIMHNVQKHFARRGGRDPSRWNEATDAEINPLLRDAGFSLPEGAIFPGEGKYANLPKDANAERYYDLLPERKQDDGGDQDGPQDPGGCGAVEDAGDKAEQAQAAAEMDVAVVQAAEAAKARGELPGGLDRLVQEIVAPKVNWRDVLRELVSSFAKNDYTWTQPSRRYIPMGLYLPSLRSEELGDVTLAIDTSGSIGQKELGLFAGEAQGIFESYKCAVRILYHDSEVVREERWEPSDGKLTLTPCGGGGTDHNCVFDRINESGELPTALVCLTDMWSSFPQLPPAYPVIWARIGGGGTIPAYGRLVDVE